MLQLLNNSALLAETQWFVLRPMIFCVLAHMDEMYCIVVCSPVHKRPRRLTGNGGVLGNLRRNLIETAEFV